MSDFLEGRVLCPMTRRTMRRLVAVAGTHGMSLAQFLDAFVADWLPAHEGIERITREFK